jgi:hypothetical protein
MSAARNNSRFGRRRASEGSNVNMAIHHTFSMDTIQDLENDVDSLVSMD